MRIIKQMVALHMCRTLRNIFLTKTQSLQMLALLLLAVARGDTVNDKAWEHFGLLNELRAEGSWPKCTKKTQKSFLGTTVCSF